MLRSILKQLVLVMLTMTTGMVVFLVMLALSKWAFGSHWFGVVAAIVACLVADVSMRVKREREDVAPRVKEIV